MPSLLSISEPSVFSFYQFLSYRLFPVAGSTSSVLNFQVSSRKLEAIPPVAGVARAKPKEPEAGVAYIRVLENRGREQGQWQRQEQLLIETREQ